ncbi:IclR family transcriptional regulator [Amycolatopsis sp. NPDC051903]|uniref:IclR family transcriptional regulator n=1 Tax=Amycolatopsis sp. NPDC051903 TaxID=3363936 RepID=UPI003798D2BB
MSQTLSRGLQVLELLAREGRPLTAQEMAKSLGLSRPIVYRLLHTLAQHHLLSNEVENGRYDLGLGLLSLSRSVQKDLRSAAFPIIKSLVHQLDTTAVLGLRDGDEVVYVLAVEPEFARMAVRSREGTRRPIDDSTSGLALRLTLEPSPDDDEELRQARAKGFAARHIVIDYQATAIAAPIPSFPGPSDACVTVLFPNVIDDIDDKAAVIVEAAQRVARVVRI